MKIVKWFKGTPRFIHGGWWIARNAAEPEIRAAVMRDYAERLEDAAGAEANRLRKEIEQEIKTRLKTVAPPDGLY